MEILFLAETICRRIMDMQSNSFSYIKAPMNSQNGQNFAELDSLRKEGQQLRSETVKNANNRDGSQSVSADGSELLMQANSIPALGRVNYTNREVLRGHLSKIYAMHWSADSKNIVSASQDGKMIVWNAKKNFKLFLVPLTSAWVMTCAYAPSGDFICCGGLDNVCTIYSLTGRDGSAKLLRALIGHDAFISCARFVDDTKLLTASGDKKIVLWDVELGTNVRKFVGHTAEVMSVCMAPRDANTLVSGACDRTAKLWDIRAPQCVLTFPGHTDDINDVKYFPSGHALATASDDGTSRMFDLSSCQQIAKYGPISTSNASPVTSCDFSTSGRLLFTGDETFNCRVWDSLKQVCVGMISGHSQRVSCLGVAPDGSAICTGSWDGLLKIWN